MADDNPKIIDLSSSRDYPGSPERGLPQQRLPQIPLSYAQPWILPGMPPTGQDSLNVSGNLHMEINNHHLSHKDAQLAGLVYPIQLSDTDIQAQCSELENQYRQQAELLSRQFDEQRRRLAQEQQIKMNEYLKAMMVHKQQQEFVQQQQLQEQQQESEIRERQKLDLIKHKGKSEQSAIASSEVKQKLRDVLLSKNTNHLKNSPPDFRQWATQHSSLEQHSPPTSGLSPPLRPGHLMGRFEQDYPLRKTVSEPNLKMRSNFRHHKQISRNSPLTRRRDICTTTKRHQLAIDTTHSSSNPDSGPNSPPLSSLSSATDSSGNAAPPGPSAPKEQEGAPPLSMMSRMVTNQSMPNISIGIPQNKLHIGDGQSLSFSGSEVELRARAAMHYGIPLSYPYYPMVSPIVPEGEISPTNAAFIEAQMKALENAQSVGLLHMPHHMPTLLNTMSLPESSHPLVQQRPPLQKAQSSPLPLHLPKLWNQPLLLQKQQEQLMKETQKTYLKQKLQSTLLQRSGSKTQMENVDEAAENRLAAEGASTDSRDSDIDVVVIDDHKDIDVTTTHRPPKREREAFLHKMRQRAISSSSPPIAPHENHIYGSASMDVDLQASAEKGDRKFTTGVSYDLTMLMHECLCRNNSVHPENPDRLHSVLSRLEERGLLRHCEKIKSRKATPEELKTCHSEAYVNMYSSNSNKWDKQALETFFPRFCKLPCGGIGVDSDTVWNEVATPQATRMAAGCVIDLAFKVARGDLQNGFALVRPPGHHAEDTLAMGFCFFNSIAVATKLLLDQLKLKRILIIDWDVHHGNSTQQLFYTDPRVLYISLHRHDNGNFFPGTGAPEDCGIDKGVGFNVNIAFAGMLNPPMGDAEYLAAFRMLVMPIARKFNPELVLVSAGFDAADGHPAPLGGYKVSPACFAYMTKQLMQLAGGKVVLVLEGGYVIPPMCDSVEMCMRVLLGLECQQISEQELHRQPCKAAIETMETTIKCQAAYWPCLTRHYGVLRCSYVEAKRLECDEADTVSAFASLSVVPEQTTSQPAIRIAPHSAREQPMEES